MNLRQSYRSNEALGSCEAFPASKKSSSFSGDLGEFGAGFDGVAVL